MVTLLIPHIDRALRAVESAKGALEIAQAELEGLRETAEGMADYSSGATEWGVLDQLKLIHPESAGVKSAQS